MLLLLPLMLTSPRPAAAKVRAGLDDPALWGRVVRITLMAVVCAHLLAWYVLAPLTGRAPSVPVLLLATAVPVLLAPWVSWRLIGLQRALRQTRGELRHLARVDPLTQLHNRTRFLETLAGDLTRAQRHAAPQAVLLLDLDHFRAFNEAHGPAAGDALLCAVADALRDTLRPSDPIARWGGDQFLIGLYGCDAGDAVVWAGRVRAAVAGVRLPLDSEQVLPPTASSVGWAVAPAGALTSAALIRTAEATLRSVKRARDSDKRWLDPASGQVATALDRVLIAARDDASASAAATGATAPPATGAANAAQGVAVSAQAQDAHKLVA